MAQECARMNIEFVPPRGAEHLFQNFGLGIWEQLAPYDQMVKILHNYNGLKYEYQMTGGQMSNNNIRLPNGKMMEVPILFFKQGQIKFKFCSGETEYEETVSYRLPEDKFPWPSASTFWGDNPNPVQRLTMEQLDQLATETWDYTGNICNYFVMSRNRRLGVLLQIQKVVTPNGQPLAMYFDRIYALKALQVYYTLDSPGDLNADGSIKWHLRSREEQLQEVERRTKTAQDGNLDMGELNLDEVDVDEVRSIMEQSDGRYSFDELRLLMAVTTYTNEPTRPPGFPKGFAMVPVSETS